MDYDVINSSCKKFRLEYFSEQPLYGRKKTLMQYYITTQGGKCRFRRRRAVSYFCKISNVFNFIDFITALLDNRMALICLPSKDDPI